MAAAETVRISKIADRYLVFDADHVNILRRNHSLCSVLVGSTPQNPTQNIFLSLPLELLPEEAAVLLEKRAAVLVDEATYHLNALNSGDKTMRNAYLRTLQDRRSKSRKIFAEGQALKKAQSNNLEQKARAKQKTRAPKPQDYVVEESSLFGTGEDISNPPTQVSPKDRLPLNTPLDSVSRPLGVTPTTSIGLGAPIATSDHISGSGPSIRPLQRYLLSQGYFMTPGLRFGARYSVYPGDPLRFHAHFLASDYEWNEEIPMLDIVGSGRLGTSVKKGFLMGGAMAADEVEEGQSSGVRAFCIEWAGM